MAYEVVYSRRARDHLRALSARDRSIVMDAIEQQLGEQPTVETRNRFRMRPNPLAPWELRVQHLRAYYDVRTEPEPTVQVVAIGIKRRDRVSIGGEELDLGHDRDQ
jgi:mRNA-degrading endonuclease RelE of RelBE toxin-antitoxin system